MWINCTYPVRANSLTTCTICRLRSRSRWRYCNDIFIGCPKIYSISSACRTPIHSLHNDVLVRYECKGGRRINVIWKKKKQYWTVLTKNLSYSDHVLESLRGEGLHKNEFQLLRNSVGKTTTMQFEFEHLVWIMQSSEGTQSCCPERWWLLDKSNHPWRLHSNTLH